MNRFIKVKYALLVVSLIVLTSCGGVSSDAKKAAKLTNKSIEIGNQLKPGEAETLHKKSREKIHKYDEHKNRDKFYNIYIEERDKSVLK